MSGFTCMQCGRVCEGQHSGRRYCTPCLFERQARFSREAKFNRSDRSKRRKTPVQQWKSLAQQYVNFAKQEGLLAPLGDPSIRCVDCGEMATDYDHRDYSRPLEVDPVCRRCNILRGSAIAPTYKQKPKAA